MYRNLKSNAHSAMAHMKPSLNKIVELSQNVPKSSVSPTDIAPKMSNNARRPSRFATLGAKNLTAFKLKDLVGKVQKQKLTREIPEYGTTGHVWSLWCNNTTAHGVKDLYNSRVWLTRIFWGSIIFAMLVVTMYQIQNLLWNYINNPWSNIVREQPLKEGITFPNITVCNANRLSASRLADIGMNTLAASYFSYIYLEGISTSLPHNESTNTLMRTEWLKWIETPIGRHYANDTGALLTRISFNCTQLLWLCSAMLTPLFPNGNCCHNTTSVWTSYGVCYSISPFATESIQQFPGSAYGINILSDPSIDDYAPLVYNSQLREGLALIINPNMYDPMPLNPVFIRPGSHASIAVSRTLEGLVRQSTVSPFSPPCNPTRKLKILKKADYERATCVSDCFFYYIREMCNCTTIHVNAPNEEICNPYTTETCIFPLLKGKYTQAASVSKDLLNATYTELVACTHTCDQEPCDMTISYKTTISTAQFPSEASISHLSQYLNNSYGKDIEHIATHLISINIFYPMIGYTETKIIESQTFDQLVGSIGGQLGLWLGMSIVTVIQAISYLGIQIGYGFNRNKNSIDSVLPTSESPAVLDPVLFVTSGGKMKRTIH